MSTVEHLDRRVTALEERQALEERLRAAMDRDLADIKLWTQQNTRLLEVLHLGQQEHTAKFATLDRKMGELAGVVNEHSGILREHTAKFATLDRKVDELAGAVNEHTALLQEQGGRLTVLERDVTEIKGGVGRIIGMLGRMAGDPSDQ